MFNWIRTLTTCPSCVHRFMAIIVCARLLILALSVVLPVALPLLGNADPIAKSDLSMDHELATLELAFKGYVAVVFPVGPNSVCTVQSLAIQRRLRDTYRGWYQVTVLAQCPEHNIESYKIWFLCSKRNVMTCALIPAPLDQTEMVSELQ